MIPLALPLTRPGLKSPSDLCFEEFKLYNANYSHYTDYYLNNNQYHESEMYDDSLAADLTDALLIEQSGDLRQFIIGNDCTLAGCNIFCEKQHSVGTSCSVDDTLMTSIATDQLFDSNDVSTADEVEPYTPKIEPYTPNSDHCYSAPMKEEPYEQTDRAGGAFSPSSNGGSSTLTDTDDGEDDEDEEEVEVDVVTCDEPLASCTPPSRNTRSRDRRRNPKQAPQPKKSSPSQKASSRISKKSRKSKVAKGKRNSNNKTATSQVANRLNPAYISRQFISQLANSEDDSQDACADEFKRHEHNKLERKRRLQQRHALQNLRLCIPSLMDNAKAAKVCILQHATDFVRKLRIQERTLRETRIRESQKRSELAARLEALTKGLF